MKADLFPLNKSERTRGMILEAAYTLFLSQGFHATSMRQIAKKSNLALGGIYNHFRSKEDIFAAIIAERHHYHQIIPLLASAEGNTIDEFIHHAAHLIIDALGDHPDFLNIMLIEIVEFKGQHIPDLFEVLLPRIIEIRRRLEHFNEQIRPIPIEFLMRAFLGIFFSYYITQINSTGLKPVGMGNDALDSFADIFLNGIKSKEEITGPTLPNKELGPQG